MIGIDTNGLSTMLYNRGEFILDLEDIDNVLLAAPGDLLVAYGSYLEHAKSPH